MNKLAPLLSTAEMAAIFRVSVETIRRWRSLGKVQALRVGRGFRFRPADVTRLLESADETASCCRGAEQRS